MPDFDELTEAMHQARINLLKERIAEAAFLSRNSRALAVPKWLAAQDRSPSPKLIHGWAVVRKTAIGNEISVRAKGFKWQRVETLSPNNALLLFLFAWVPWDPENEMVVTAKCADQDP